MTFVVTSLDHISLLLLILLLLMNMKKRSGRGKIDQGTENFFPKGWGFPYGRVLSGRDCKQ